MIYNDPALWPRQQKTVTVTITGTGSSTFSYVTINDRQYTSAAVVEVERGTEILCKVAGGLGTGGTISLNGNQVSTSTYTHIANENCTIGLAFTELTTYIKSGSISIKTI